jgi:hypothetical protein
MIIPAKKRPRWLLWIMGFGITILFMAALFIWLIVFGKTAPSSESPALRVWRAILPPGILPPRPTLLPSPVTPQKTDAFFRGTYKSLNGNMLEIVGTAGINERVRVDDRTAFTCIARYRRDRRGNVVDMRDVYFDVSPGSTYAKRPATVDTGISRALFTRIAKSGDTLLITVDYSSEQPTAFWVSLFTDPCEPEKWRL